MPNLPIRPFAATLRALLIALLLGSIVVAYAVAWLSLVALHGGHNGWMALLAAPVIVASLRLLNVRSRASRSVLSLMCTAAAIALANWAVAALPIAQAMDLTPLAAALRIGPHFFWTLVTLGHTPLDWLWVALALALSAWFGR